MSAPPRLHVESGRVVLSGHWTLAAMLPDLTGLQAQLATQRSVDVLWDLSALRGTAVAKILQSEFGVNPNRITAGGRSEYNPKTTNASVSGRAENRRTEIIIMPKLDEFMKLMDIAPKK